jgi:hypothetical protein
LPRKPFQRSHHRTPTILSTPSPLLTRTFRSIVLAVKAVLLNLVSLTSASGNVVFIFQGHGFSLGASPRPSPSLHEAQHPDIRVYGDVRREIATADPLTSPGEMISSGSPGIATAN